MIRLNGEQRFLTAIIGLAGIALLLGSGCRTVDRMDNHQGHHRKGLPGTVQVTHWLTDTQTMDLPDGESGLLDLLLRTRPPETPQLAEMLLARSAQSDDQLQQQRAERIARVELVQLSRGTVDWYFPLSLLTNPVVASIPMADSDRVATLPVDVTPFRLDLTTPVTVTAPRRVLVLQLSAPEWPSPRIAAWHFADGGPAYVSISQLLRNLPMGLPWVSPPRRLLGEGADGVLGVVTISDNPLATALILSRPDPSSGRSQRLVLPTFRNREEVLASAIAMLESHGTSRILLPGDRIEITSWERIASQWQPE